MSLWPKAASFSGVGEGSAGMPPQKISAIFSAFFVQFKRPSAAANKCWSIRVRQQLMCVKETTTSKEKLGENRDKFFLSPSDYQHVVVSFTRSNLRLSTQVG